MDRKEKEEAILVLEEFIENINNDEIDYFSVFNWCKSMPTKRLSTITLKFKEPSKEDYQALEDDIVGESLYWDFVRDIVNLPRVSDPFEESSSVPKVESLSYECCRECPNNPANGGSGVCHCTLPYLTFTT